MAYSITTKKVGSGDGSTLLVTYVGLSETDIDVEPLELVEYADRSVQISGTFNGGTVTILGSNDEVEWPQLTDPQGNPLNISAGKIEQLQELTLLVKPKVLTGTGVSVNATFVLRRASGIRT
jgi:hypothetical protein